jgi:hypothetical protein
MIITIVTLLVAGTGLEAYLIGFRAGHHQPYFIPKDTVYYQPGGPTESPATDSPQPQIIQWRYGLTIDSVHDQLVSCSALTNGQILHVFDGFTEDHLPTKWTDLPVVLDLVTEMKWAAHIHQDSFIRISVDSSCHYYRFIHPHQPYWIRDHADSPGVWKIERFMNSDSAKTKHGWAIVTAGRGGYWVKDTLILPEPATTRYGCRLFTLDQLEQVHVTDDYWGLH